MPQPVQIVPTLQQPHSMTVINNNTWFDDSVAEATYYGVSSIFVINSPKGEDRTLIPITRGSNFIEEFGVGSFTQHGQPYFNAHNFLSNNQDVLAYILRVTAEDATYANAVIVAKVKATPAVEGETPSPAKFEVYFQVQNLEGIKTVDDLTSQARALREDTTPDADGFLTYPMFAIHSSGRGEYGNNLRFRLIKDTNLDLENSYLNYRLDIYELEEYLKVKNAVKGSIYEDAVEGSNTLFIGDILNDTDRTKAKIITFQDSLEDIYDSYIETINPAQVVPFEQFDFFYGFVKGENDPIEGYTLAVTDASVNLEAAEGVALVHGNDGLFKRARTDAEKLVRDAAIQDAYSKAFNGEFDKRILSKRQAPQTLFFDACYPEAIKYDIINWLIARHDGYGHLDAGIINTASDAIAWGEKFYNLGHITHGKTAQSYEIRDPFTNKRVRVTYPYFLAGNLPTHYMNAGNHVPYASSTAQLTGHVKRSVKPDIDADDTDVKEQLYVLRVNYLETMAENVYYRGTQSTSDIGETRQHWSDLNEENNVYVLLDYKRKLETMVADLTYDFAEADERQQFTEDARRMLSPDIGTKVYALDVLFDMTPWEEQRSILHCYLSVEFRPLVKRSIIEIDVNPRS